MTRISESRERARRKIDYINKIDVTEKVLTNRHGFSIQHFDFFLHLSTTWIDQSASVSGPGSNSERLFAQKRAAKL